MIVGVFGVHNRTHVVPPGTSAPTPNVFDDRAKPYSGRKEW